MRFLFVLCLSAVLARTTSAGNVLIVSPSIPGAYTQIQPAVDAAQDGDLVLVKSGTYSFFQIVDKSLTVVADASAVVQVDGIRVQNLSATRTVVLSGLRANGTSGSLSLFSALYLSNNAGSVRALDCSLSGYYMPAYSYPICASGAGAWIENCQDAVLINCDLTGGHSYSDGGAGVYAIGSRIAMYECTLHGGAGGSSDWWCYGYGDGNLGGTGCEVHTSSILTSQCTVIGGDGGFGGHIGTYGGSGGSGAILSSYPAAGAQFRNLECTFAGGIAHCGPAGCGYPGIPFSADPGTLNTTYPGMARRLTTSSVVRELAPVSIQFDGQPGDQVELRITYETGFVLSDALRGVKITRQPKPELVYPVGTVGPSGTISGSWVIPDLGPGVQSQVLILQAVFTDSSGQPTLSRPSVVALLDQAF